MYTEPAWAKPISVPKSTHMNIEPAGVKPLSMPKQLELNPNYT